MSVTARVRCTNDYTYRFTNSSGEEVVSSKQVTLTPVYDSDPTSPNYSFSQATPSGIIQLSITNPDAYNQFEVNKVYDVTFTEYVAESA